MLQEDRKWPGYRRKEAEKTSNLTYMYIYVMKMHSSVFFFFWHISESSPAPVSEAGPKDEPISMSLVKMTVSRCCRRWAQSEVSFVTVYFPAHLQPINVLPQGTCCSALTFLWISQHEMETAGQLTPHSSFPKCQQSHFMYTESLTGGCWWRGR